MSDDCSGTLELGVRGLTKIRWSEKQSDPLGSPSSLYSAKNVPFSQQDRGFLMFILLEEDKAESLSLL